MTRQAIRGAKKSGSHIAESVLRNPPANIHFDAPSILVKVSCPARRHAIPAVLAVPLEAYRHV